MSHNTIPHTNVMIAEMGKITGAWEAEFNNDLDNLKYPKIKEYDARLPEQHRRRAAGRTRRARRTRAIRAGRRRARRHPRHAVGVAQLGRVRRDDWRAERAAPHRAGRDEGLRPGQPAHEAVRAARTCRFARSTTASSTRAAGRLRWDSVRVLLTVALDDPKIEPRPWNGYKRPDNIYPVAWIRTLRQGTRFLQLARPHAGDVHDARDRRAFPGRPAVHARRSRG